MIFLVPEDRTPNQPARPCAHLDTLVAEGCCGLLARRDGYEEAGQSLIDSQQVLAEFLGLLQVSMCK